MFSDFAFVIDLLHCWKISGRMRPKWTILRLQLCFPCDCAALMSVGKWWVSWENNRGGCGGLGGVIGSWNDRVGRGGSMFNQLPPNPERLSPEFSATSLWYFASIIWSLRSKLGLLGAISWPQEGLLVQQYQHLSQLLSGFALAVSLASLTSW